MNIKIKINSQRLKKALNVLYKVSYEYKIVDFSSFFIKAEKNSLFFLAMNDTICVQHQIINSKDLTITGEGKFIVNAFILNELIQKTNEDIVLEMIEPSILTVKTKSYKTKINTIDLNFWRTKKISLQGTKWKLDAQKIKQLISQVSYATHNKEGKRIFQGINFRTSDQKIIAAATDGSCIARRSFVFTDGKVNLTLPLNALVEANRILNLEKTKTLDMTFGEKAVLFEIGDDTKIYSKIIEDGDEFPNIERQFLQKFESKVVCSVQKLISAIEKASVFFEKNSFPVVVLSIIKDQFVVASSEKNTSGFFEEVIEDAKIEGKNQQVNLQVKFILTTLRSLESKEVLIKFSSSQGPVFFSEDQNEDLKVLILPFWIY